MITLCPNSVGSFDWTTDDPLNSYVDGAGLHIVPTMTLDSTDITPEQLQGLQGGYTLNLTSAGTCTSSNDTACSVVSNATTHTIINPVRSARINTQGKHTITYGRIEVVAKMPKGDWLWPAIWMLPDEHLYGEWPLSGEIDILESRGNAPANYTYDGGARQMSISTLHWGLDFKTDMFQLSTHKYTLRRKDFSEEFHTFGFEWTEDYIFIYIDNRLSQSLAFGFSSKLGTLWQRGKFVEKLGYTA